MLADDASLFREIVDLIATLAETAVHPLPKGWLQIWQAGNFPSCSAARSCGSRRQSMTCAAVVLPPIVSCITDIRGVSGKRARDLHFLPCGITTLCWSIIISSALASWNQKQNMAPAQQDEAFSEAYAAEVLDRLDDSGCGQCLDACLDARC